MAYNGGRGPGDYEGHNMQNLNPHSQVSRKV